MAGTFLPHAPESQRETLALKPVAPGQEQKDCAHYGNTAGGFAALDQITREREGP